MQINKLAIAALIVSLLAITPAASAQTPRKTIAAELSGSIEATADIVTPSVVEIFTTAYVPGEGLVPRSGDLVTTQRGSGSGVIVDPNGYIITNAHVVRGAQRVRVDIAVPPAGRSILATRTRSTAAEIVGLDLETDLAVIKVDDRNLPAAAFGDSDELKMGQLVLAFGSPLGLHNSVSLGVVSAVARQLEADSPMIYVQTDASINSGSSGGPLVDLRGRVIGINTLILSERGGYEGLGFAAPSNIVKNVYEQIRKNGRVRRGDIGVRAQTLTPALAAGLGLLRNDGVILGDVLPRSPAARAGLRVGDVVVALDGKPMENSRQFQVNLYRRFAGDRVTIDILRDGQAEKVPVAITEREDAFADLSGTIDPRNNLVHRLGILGITMDQRIAELLPALRVRAGIVVASTVDGAVDSRDGGLLPGDIVYAVNRKPVASLADLRAAIDALKPGDAIVLHIERRGELVYLAFTLE